MTPSMPMRFDSTTTSAKMIAIALVSFALSLSTTIAAPFIVSGKCNPWLAGATNGTTADTNDVAPAESPFEVAGFILVPGSAFSFTVSGGVNHDGGVPSPPDGDIAKLHRHRAGAEHGISDINTAPYNCLLGVFLSADLPDGFPAPSPLDFSTQAKRDYTVLSPLLKQVFFIGDGRTSVGVVTQKVIVPTGATRLFLGPMDTYGWYNNSGSFTVEVAYAQSPLLRIRISDTQATDVQVSWSSQSDLKYQVEYISDFISSPWLPLGPPVQGTGTTNRFVDSTLGDSRRFYRLVVQP